MVITITPLYALAAAVIYLVLFMRVSALRGKTGISTGEGGNALLLQRIRQHGNCAEWCSFVLILMILAEGAGVAPLWLHAAGALLILGRIAHPFGLAIDNAAHPLRYIGNGTNITAALIAMVGIAVQALAF